MTSAAAAGKPDLVVASVTVGAEARQGERLSITDKVVNKGPGKADRSASILYLSEDAKRGGDIKLKPARAVVSLRPRAASKGTTRAVVPATVPLGDYFVLACADGTRKVPETNERNNCRASTSKTIVNPAPTSHELIDQQVAAGTLSEETGLIYKVFSDFGDPRLPSKFVGEPNGLSGGALEEAAEEWLSLSAEAQQTLRPFLIPPYYAGSYADPSPPPPARLNSAQTSTDLTPWCAGTVTLDTWNYIDTPSGDVRIWWLAQNVNDDLIAHHFAAILENKIMPALKSLMGRGPKSDGGGACDGESPALDIALTDIKTATTYADGLCGSSGTSAHMMFPRSASSVGWAGLDPYLAHEVMHAVQYAMPLASLWCGKYKWVREATAQWVQDFVTDPVYGIGLGPDDTEFQAAPIYLNKPEVSLDVDSPPAFHSYGDYLLPFWAVRKSGPSFVKNVWAAAATKEPVDAVDAALPGGFEATWADFALANWNDGPVKDYRAWDDLTAGAVTIGPEPIPRDVERNPSISVNHLAAKYLELDIDEKVTELEFTNDVPGDKERKIRAVLTYDDGSHDIKDLSTAAKTVLCIDDGNKRATKVVLIFSNASKTEDLQFRPTLLGKKECGCPNSDTKATPRTSPDRAAQPGGCTFRGNVTFSFSEASTEPRFRWEDSGSGDVSLFLFEDPTEPGYFESKNSSYSVSSSGSSHYDRDGECADEFADWTSEGSGVLEDGAIFAYLNGDVLEVYHFFLPVTQRGTGGFECGETQQHEPFETATGPGSCPVGSDGLFYPFVRQGGEDSKVFAFECTSTGPSNVLGLPATRTVTINATVNLGITDP